MKCLICGTKTNRRILCKKHVGNTEARSKYLSAHVCTSFLPREGHNSGLCKNNLMCEPIKMALKEQPFFNNLGHVVCKYPSINVYDAMHREVDEKEIDGKYPECLD